MVDGEVGVTRMDSRVPIICSRRIAAETRPSPICTNAASAMPITTNSMYDTREPPNSGSFDSSTRSPTK